MPQFPRYLLKIWSSKNYKSWGINKNKTPSFTYVNKKTIKKTKELQLETKYDEMQNKVNENVREINRNFISMKSLQLQHTIYVHKIIYVNEPVKRAGSRKR